MPQTTNHILERADVTPEVFEAEVVPAGRPVVMRGLVADWPVTLQAAASRDALFAYLRRFDQGQSVTTMMAPPTANGRFFYNDDLSGFNFRRGSAKLQAALEFLGSDDPQGALAVQSMPVRANLPGFEADNPMPLLRQGVEPRIWLGNAVIVAAHHDPSENIACVTAGRRRFTLFPPEQVANLYMGPFELTPAGATISMVEFENPDLHRFPRFADAMAAAQVADLEPGDAIYIPYLWWHHVRSFERVNMLVNYWWTPQAQRRGAPRDAFLHAILALRELPETHRAAWRALYDHYVFQTGGPTGAHLPPDKRGILGDMTPEAVRSMREALAKVLSRS